MPLFFINLTVNKRTKIEIETTLLNLRAIKVLDCTWCLYLKDQDVINVRDFLSQYLINKKDKLLVLDVNDWSSINTDKYSKFR